MSKSMSTSAQPESSRLSVRSIAALALVVAGIAWLVYYYVGVRPDPDVPDSGGSKTLVDLGLWNYVIGFGAVFLGLIVLAHPSTPMGRGRGVVIGMLGCFGLGLLWICTFYVFSDDLSAIPVFNDLGQWNLAVGIAFMAVGFSFATRWE